MPKKQDLSSICNANRNPLVPGSSPGGPTNIKTLTSDSGGLVF